MGKRGPQPKPTAIKKLAGNPGRQKLTENEVAPVIGNAPPEPPEYLGEIAKAEWKRIARTLWLNSCLGDLDFSMFALYCQAFEDWRMASIAVERQAQQEAQIMRDILAWEVAEPTTRGSKPELTTAYGALVIQTTNGNVVQNPLVGLKNTARLAMIKAAGSFGLSPASRVGLDTLRLANPSEPTRKTESPAQNFLNRGPRLAVSNP